jgi:DNA-binding transcriptional LysR family regulator
MAKLLLIGGIVAGVVDKLKLFVFIQVIKNFDPMGCAMIRGAFTLKQLEALICVADLGSFRKAAQHLNTTQPNISTRIAGLETVLQTTLMHRDAGSVQMTGKGQKVLDAARAVLRQAEAMIEVAEQPDLIDDTLRLGVTEMVACTWIRPYLRDLREMYPNLSVALTVDLSVNLDRDLAARALDLTIQNAPFATASSGLVPLEKAGYVWVARPDVAHALPGGTNLDRLADVTILTHAPHTRAFMELAEAFRKRRLRPRLVPSNSLTSCLYMAEDGMGAAVVPAPMAVGAMARGDLVEVPVEWCPTPLEFAARFNTEVVARYVGRAAQAAADRARM